MLAAWVSLSLIPRLLPMRYAGKRLAAGSNFLGPIPIRSASWINHVTSHALTMVTHLRQKKINAEEIERALKANWAHFLWGSTVGG